MSYDRRIRNDLVVCISIDSIRYRVTAIALASLQIGSPIFFITKDIGFGFWYVFTAFTLESVVFV